MIQKLYRWLHRCCSRPDERGEYSAGHWQDQVRRQAVALCAEQEGKIIEIGCGEGLFLAQLAARNRNASLYGVDIWPEIVRQAQMRMQAKGYGHIQLSCADGTALPFDSGQFSAVVCINVFFNLPSPDTVAAVLREICRVSAAGARIVFDIRNRRNPLLFLKYKFAKYYDHTVRNVPLRTYALSEITAMARDAGLTVVRTYPVGFPFRALAPIIIVEAEKRCA